MTRQAENEQPSRGKRGKDGPQGFFRNLLRPRGHKEQPAATTPSTPEAARGLFDEAKISGFVEQKVGEITRFRKGETEETGVGSTLVLFSDETGGLLRREKEVIVKALYAHLGAEIPTDLDGTEPEVQQIFGLHQQHGDSPDSARFYGGTNKTTVGSSVQVAADLAIVRSTLFIWENHSKRPLSKSTTHSLVRTEPKPEAVGSVEMVFAFSSPTRQSL